MKSERQRGIGQQSDTKMLCGMKEWRIGAVNSACGLVRRLEYRSNAPVGVGAGVSFSGWWVSGAWARHSTESKCHHTLSSQAPINQAPNSKSSSSMACLRPESIGCVLSSGMHRLRARQTYERLHFESEPPRLGYTTFRPHLMTSSHVAVVRHHASYNST